MQFIRYYLIRRFKSLTSSDAGRWHLVQNDWQKMKICLLSADIKENI